MKVYVIGIVLVIGTVFANGAATGERENRDRFMAVATTNIVGDIVGQIGGVHLSLYVMLQPGVDVHVFQPTPGDARYVADAEVVFVNGAGLEAKFLGDLINNVSPRRVVDLSADLHLRTNVDGHVNAENFEDVHEDHPKNGVDPHVWMDPTMVAVWASEIVEVLTEVDPIHAAYYTRRANTLVEELLALDMWVREQVADIPTNRRVLVTDHEVLGYFADRYSFEILDTISPGLNEASEPSVRQLAKLRNVLAEHEVPAIFVGTSTNRRVAQAVVDDLGIEVVSIYTESLSASDGPADTYQNLIVTNVQRIVAALDND